MFKRFIRMTVISENPVSRVWRVPRIISGTLLIAVAFNLAFNFTLDTWDSLVHPMYPIPWQELLFILIACVLVLAFYYLLFAAGLSLVKRGELRQNWVGLTSVGKSSARVRNTLLLICGSSATFIGFLGMIMFALFVLVSLASMIRLLPSGEFLSVDQTTLGWIFVFWYLVFSAGIFLLQRSEMPYLLSAATSKKVAWAYKSISVNALLNLMQRLCSNYFKSFILWNKSAGTRDRIRLALAVFLFIGIIGLLSYIFPETIQSPRDINYAIKMEYAECVAKNGLPGDSMSITTLKPLEMLSPKERGVVLGCAVSSQRAYMIRWALGAKTDSILVDRKLDAVLEGQTLGSWPMATIASWSDSDAAIEAITLLVARENSIFPASAITEQRLDAVYSSGTFKVARYLDSLWPELVQGELNRMNSTGQNTSKYYNLTLAQYHALHGRFDVAEYFEGKGSKIKPMRHLVFDIKRGPLFDDYKLDQFLVSRGDTIEERDAQNRTLLHRAVEKYDGEKLVRQLVDRGADVNAQDIAGNAPLHYMVREGNHLRLLDKANLNLQNLKGRTPLHEALAASAWDKATFLMDRGARLDIRDIQGRTPLLDCALQACPLLDRLMAPGAGISAVDANGNSLLHLVAHAKGNKAEMIEKMLAKGAPYNSKNKAGQTPLHLFSKSGDVGLVKLLLAKGCNPNDVDATGNTPMHFAPTTEIVSSLLYAGANPDIANQRGERPLDGNVARTQMLFHSPSQINSKAETLPHYFRDIRIGEERVELSSPIAGTFMLGADSDEARNGAIWFIARTPSLEYRIEQTCQTSVRLIVGNDSLTLYPLSDNKLTALTPTDQDGVFLVRGQATSCTIPKVSTDTIIKNLMGKGKQVAAKWLATAKRCNAKNSCQIQVTPILQVSVKSGEDWRKVGVLSARNSE